MLSVFLKGALFAGPRIPLGCVLLGAAILYAYKDATWAIEARARAKAAVAEVVSAEQLAALRAQLEAERILAEDREITNRAQQKLIDAQQESLAEFAKENARRAIEIQDRDDEIDEILASRPVFTKEELAACAPPDGFFDKLRDKSN
jgi:hypothetical protein